MTYILEFKPETEEKIRAAAALRGIEPQKVIEEVVEKQFESPDLGEDFEQLSEYLFEKNAELYRRLA